MPEHFTEGSAPLRDVTKFLARAALDRLIARRPGAPALTLVPDAGVVPLPVLTVKVRMEDDQTVKPGRIEAALAELATTLTEATVCGVLPLPAAPGLLSARAVDERAGLALRVIQAYDLDANATVLTFQIAAR